MHKGRGSKLGFGTLGLHQNCSISRRFVKGKEGGVSTGLWGLHLGIPRHRGRICLFRGTVVLAMSTYNPTKTNPNLTLNPQPWIIFTSFHLLFHSSIYMTRTVYMDNTPRLAEPRILRISHLARTPGVSGALSPPRM